MSSVTSENLDSKTLKRAVGKILEHSGLAVSENTEESSQITFFARSGDPATTIGVSCAEGENAFSVTEMEKLVTGGQPLGCDSYMLVSPSTFTPEEAEFAGKHRITLVDHQRFMQTLGQLPEAVRQDIE
ncbi:MAG: restriction endonuclease, partial [Verrucomicrobiales bacterium]|nr:restriction endonuclease [Verrucomicrobiales bacterium]